MGFKRAVILLLFLLPSMLVAQNEITIDMNLSSDIVSLGGSVNLIIKVTGPQNLPKPQLPNLSMFDYYSQGTATNISIVNGQMTSSVTYNYILMPKRDGTFVIRPAVLVYNQKRYTSGEVTLKVLPSGKQAPPSDGKSSSTGGGETRNIFLTAEVDKKSGYVNEQIMLSIKFFYTGRLNSQPDYTAPQLTDFWPYDITPQNTYNEVIDGRRYKVIEIRTALFPTRSGELTIGPAMIKVVVPGKQRRRTDPFRIFNDFFQRGENKTIRTKPIKVKIKPLPAEGKPDNFSGTVGRFRISSSVDKRTIGVNQPVTVTYRITGSGNVKTVAEPKFGDTKDFRIYNASSDEKVSQVSGIIGGTKIFEEVFIPKRAGKMTIPAAKSNYFDPVEKKYKLLSSQPIELTVTPSEVLTYEDYPRAVAGRVVDAGIKDILFIKTESGNLGIRQPPVIVRPIYLAINGLPVLLLVVALVSRRWQDKLAGDVGFARSRAARRMARKRLVKAKKIAHSNQAEKFYAELRTAIFSYVADKMNISPHGLTGERVTEIIENSGAGEDIRNQLKDLFKKADFAQYSSVEVSLDQINRSLAMAEKIMVGLEDIKIA